MWDVQLEFRGAHCLNNNYILMAKRGMFHNGESVFHNSFCFPFKNNHKLLKQLFFLHQVVSLLHKIMKNNTKQETRKRRSNDRRFYNMRY